MGARRGAEAIELKARQRWGCSCLRHGRVYREGKSRWTQKHFRWLEEQKFEHPVQQVVWQEYIDTVVEARTRVASVEEQMRQALEGWSRSGDGPQWPSRRATIGYRAKSALTPLHGHWLGTRTTGSGMALDEERANGTCDRNDQLGFGMIDVLLLADVASAVRSVAPKFVNAWSSGAGRSSKGTSLPSVGLGCPVISRAVASRAAMAC